MNWNRANSPLLASPQGGVAASSKKHRVATEADADGVVFLFVSIGKPPRPRCQRMLRNNVYTRAATPPCGDARRGLRLISIHSRLHSKGTHKISQFRKHKL